MIFKIEWMNYTFPVVDIPAIRECFNSTTNKLKKALIYHLRFNAIKMLKKVSLAYLTQVET